MARPVRFEDAARLLAGNDDTLIKVVDRALDGVLLITGQFGLFDPKNALVGLLRDLRARASERYGAGPRRDRGDVMVAAHTVLVVAAFFGELGTYAELGALRWRREDETKLVGSLLAAEAPVPAAHMPPERLAVELFRIYASLAGQTQRFLTGLAIWDDLTENERMRVSARLGNETPAAAVRRYDRYLTDLAGAFPGFAFWVGHREHAATREQLSELRAGLAEVAQLLAAKTPAGDLNRRWRELARRYATDLQAPVVVGGDHGAPPDLVIPSLGAAYVDPAFRVAVFQPNSRPAEDRWWDEGVEVRDDLAGFLVRHLSAPDATVRPLLVLGHPGAGKSVFTRAFAARLQDTGFRPLRVDLRRVPADAPIIDQVRVALRDALQRDVDWADLADDSGEGTPVIFFDGFDELLQSATAGRSDYLERLCEFQDIARVTRDCPVAVVVTSRTVVADRARIPASTTIIRLEPFNQARVARWLETWNRANTAYHAKHRLIPLTSEALTKHAHLAAQPLLLLMLALYDAADNALQREGRAIADADLYDRLLRSFARREMRKGREHEDDAVIEALLEKELERLAVAALAMFNRRSRHVTDDELDADLSALLATGEGGARRLVGRFFFVHVAEAQFELTRRTYEFLHATFGEYLVAWFVTRALPQPPPPRALTTIRTDVDDALLAAVLSFDLLAFSMPTVDFLGHLFGKLHGRRQAYELLLEAFRQRHRRPAWHGHEAYAPTDLEFIERAAAYSANLILLIALAACGGWCPLSELFGPHAPDELERRWRREVRLWLARHGRSSVDALEAMLEYRPGDHAAVRLKPQIGTPAIVTQAFGRLELRNRLVREPEVARLLDAASPLLRQFDTELHATAPGHRPPAHALLDVLLHSNATSKDYVSAAKAAFDLPADRREEYATLLLNHLAACHSPVQPAAFLEILPLLDNTATRSFLQCLAAADLPPQDRTDLACVPKYPFEVLVWLLEEAASDLRLVPIAVDVLASRSGAGRDRQLTLSLTAILQYVPDRIVTAMDLENLRALGDLVPPGVLARRQAHSTH